jgi:ferredoxin
MATLSDRNPDNAPGRYYIDSSCIDCDQCRTTAPELFARNAETGFSSVLKQPLTAEEVALAEEVLTACPTQSIGNDGA